MNYFEIVYEVMNVKETLIIKVLEALLYKKIVNFRYLSILHYFRCYGEI